ncbi:acyl-CoA-binding protein [Flavobacterium sp. NRK F10]|uniref:Phosphatidylserine decarboxylase n=1 Tax=Flavobacterium sediminis TaxID=2201181 RepID=A0A2U8QXH2_9FLAO|nr:MULTISPECIES: acyl-CoA-binding protein [Flavobacterium]AWM14505.1 phosphatidylserine decarboxylase [Flavobacterium sediminis]MCO6175736.1 acyl-CoA-binding protein [Flavobacterium sp. NRK F10]
MSTKDLDTLFDEAFENANLVPKESVPQDVQLVLYGLYKHAISGRINESSSNDVNDLGEDLRNAFKLNAWMQIKHLSIEEAKQRYIDIINQLMRERGLL